MFIGSNYKQENMYLMVKFIPWQKKNHFPPYTTLQLAQNRESLRICKPKIAKQRSLLRPCRVFEFFGKSYIKSAIK